MTVNYLSGLIATASKDKNMSVGRIASILYDKGVNSKDVESVRRETVSMLMNNTDSLIGKIVLELIIAVIKIILRRIEITRKVNNNIPIDEA